MQICKLARRVKFMLMFQAIGTHLQSFTPKFCKIKVVWRFIHKKLVNIAKINIYEHIQQIFLINFNQYIGKNNKIQKIFQRQSLKTCMFDLAKIWELVCLSLCSRPTLISNRTTSFCL